MVALQGRTLVGCDLSTTLGAHRVVSGVIRRACAGIREPTHPAAQSSIPAWWQAWQVARAYTAGEKVVPTMVSFFGGAPPEFGQYSDYIRTRSEYRPNNVRTLSELSPNFIIVLILRASSEYRSNSGRTTPKI